MWCGLADIYELNGELHMKKPIDVMLDQVKWEPVTYKGNTDYSELPYVTHEGVLDIAGFKMRVMQLSDGQRIIDAEDFHKFFGSMQ